MSGRRGSGGPVFFQILFTADALAAGVTFIGMPVPQTVVAVMLIGIITFLLSAIGVRIGSVFGTRFKSKAEFVGGLVLIFLGVKIFVEHMGFFGA